MKNSFLIRAFVCLFAVVALCSCNKDENGDDESKPTSVVADNTITATVENGSSYNDRIEAVKVKDYRQDRELASFPYSNGGFTLTLPATVSDIYLNAFKNDDFPAGVTVSNRSVKTVSVYISAYKSGNEIGEFYYKTSDWYGILWYADGDVSITGSSDEVGTTKYNAHLKKGWNIVYIKYVTDIENEKISEMTTQAPTGLKWYYEEWEEEEEEDPTGAIVDNTITATAVVDIGNYYNEKIDSVRAYITSGIYIASAYSNDSFTLKLPETVSDTNLSEYNSFFFLEVTSRDGITISNRNVKGTRLDIGIWSNHYLGLVNYGLLDESLERTYYYRDYIYLSDIIYSNGDVSITGNGYGSLYTYEYTYKYNAHLKKGWNIVYYHQETGNNEVEREVEITTQAPSVTLKWYAGW